MLNDFENDIRSTLKGHGVQDDNLENALAELFKQYDRRVLSKDFIEKIAHKLNEREYRKARARG